MPKTYEEALAEREHYIREIEMRRHEVTGSGVDMTTFEWDITAMSTKTDEEVTIHGKAEAEEWIGNWDSGQEYDFGGLL